MLLIIHSAPIWSSVVKLRVDSAWLHNTNIVLIHYRFHTNLIHIQYTSNTHVRTMRLVLNSCLQQIWHFLEIHGTVYFWAVNSQVLCVVHHCSRVSQLSGRNPGYPYQTWGLWRRVAHRICSLWPACWRQCISWYISVIIIDALVDVLVLLMY